MLPFSGNSGTFQRSTNSVHCEERKGSILPQFSGLFLYLARCLSGFTWPPFLKHGQEWMGRIRIRGAGGDGRGDGQA